MKRRAFLALLGALPFVPWSKLGVVVPRSLVPVPPPVAAAPAGPLTFMGMRVVVDPDCPPGMLYLVDETIIMPGHPIEAVPGRRPAVRIEGIGA